MTRTHVPEPDLMLSQATLTLAGPARSLALFLRNLFPSMPGPLLEDLEVVGARDALMPVVPLLHGNASARARALQHFQDAFLSFCPSGYFEAALGLLRTLKSYLVTKVAELFERVPQLQPQVAPE